MHAGGKEKRAKASIAANTTRKKAYRPVREVLVPREDCVRLGGLLGQDLVKIEHHAVAKQLPRDRRAAPLENVAGAEDKGWRAFA